MATQTRKIIVQATASGEKAIKDIANSLDKLNKSAKESSGVMNQFRNVAGTIFGAQILGIGVRELTNMADTMTQLNSKLNIFVGGGDKATAAFESLVKIADDSRSPLTAVATIFTRIATSTERLGLSTELQLTLTRLLQQSFRVSGATAEEATASTIQFAQALSFGQLRGQELRSVLSQNSALATIFGKAIEGSGKDIYKFAEAGGFTTKFVLKALLENMDGIEKKANQLAPTFEQTLNRAMNQVTLSVKRLNDQFKISEGFATFVDYILKNGDAVVTIITSLAVAAIPKLTASIIALNFASLANPFVLFGAALAGLTFAAIKAAGGMKEFIAELKILPSVLSLISLEFAELLFNFATLGTALFIDNPLSRFLNKNKKELSDYIISVRAAANQIESGIIAKDPPSLGDLLDEVNKLDTMAKKLTLDEKMGLLNQALAKGSISAQKFVAQMVLLESKELEEKFFKGQISLEKFNEEMSKLKITDMARQLDVGIISIDQFNAGVNEFKIEELNRKFNAGKIAATEFKNELVKLQIEGLDPERMRTGVLKGTQSVIESMGTFSEQIASVTKNAFQSLEDKLVESTQTGKFAFKEMAQSILDDLTRIAIRMAIVKPLSEGILGSFFGNSTAAAPAAGSGNFNFNPSVVAANGAVLNRGVERFASGGVVNSPTYFGLSGGKMGLMGEAGPEAIVPLKRSSDGSLGVKASPTVINVINNTSSEVQTRESTDANGSKVIDVMIMSKVKDGIANGSFDRAFQQSFGLNRRGF